MLLFMELMKAYKEENCTFNEGCNNFLYAKDSSLSSKMMELLTLF